MYEYLQYVQLLTVVFVYGQMSWEQSIEKNKTEYVFKMGCLWDGVKVGESGWRRGKEGNGVKEKRILKSDKKQGVI